MARYYKKLSWASARFAMLTDLALLTLGSRLKLREKLSGRFADVLSWMYLGFCALRRFEAEGRRAEDLPLARWAVEHALFRIQTAFEGIYPNFGGPLGWLLRRRISWIRFAPVGLPPSDLLGAEVADVLRRPGLQRDRLTAGLFLPKDPNEPLAKLERAFLLVRDAAPLLHRIAKARLSMDEALEAGIVTPDEADVLRSAAKARAEVLQVDSFSLEEYLGLDGKNAGPGWTRLRENAHLANG